MNPFILYVLHSKKGQSESQNPLDTFYNNLSKNHFVESFKLVVTPNVYKAY